MLTFFRYSNMNIWKMNKVMKMLRGPKMLTIHIFYRKSHKSLLNQLHDGLNAWMRESMRWYREESVFDDLDVTNWVTVWDGPSIGQAINSTKRPCVFRNQMIQCIGDEWWPRTVIWSSDDQIQHGIEPHFDCLWVYI